jgi:hypothetical protein
MLTDTHPDAEKVQIELIRKMGVAERLALMRNWTRTMVHFWRQGLTKAHPGLDERELDLLWVEQHYGRDLAVRLRAYLEARQPCSTATP